MRNRKYYGILAVAMAMIFVFFTSCSGSNAGSTATQTTTAAAETTTAAATTTAAETTTAAPADTTTAAADTTTAAPADTTTAAAAAGAPALSLNQTPHYTDPYNPGDYKFDTSPSDVVKIDFGIDNWGPDTWDPTVTGVNSWWMTNYNIDLTMDLINQANFDQLMTAKIAAHNAPDLWLTRNRQNIFKYAQQGSTLTPLNDLIQNELPVFGNNLEDSNLMTAKDAQGNIVAVPLRGPAIENVWMIRKDWLDALGLPAPTTVQEVLDDAVKFQDNSSTLNTDGTQLFAFDDSSGEFFSSILSANDVWGSYNPQAKGTPINSSAAWQIIDGKLTWDITTDGYKNAVSWWADQVKAGHFYQDWNNPAATNDTYTQAIVANKFGVFAGTSWWVADPWSSALKNDPNSKMSWISLPNIPNMNGNKVAPSNNPYTGAWIVLNKSLSDSGNEEKLARTMVFTDQLLACQNEGNWVTFMGTQKDGTTTLGTKMVMVDGTPTEDQSESYWFTKSMSYASIRGLDDSIDYLLPPDKQILQADPYRMQLQKPARTQTDGISTIDQYFDLSATQQWAQDQGKYFSSQLANFMTGKTPMDQWDSFVNDMMTKYHGNDMRDIYVKQLQAYGFDVQ